MTTPKKTVPKIVDASGAERPDRLDTIADALLDLDTRITAAFADIYARLEQLTEAVRTVSEQQSWMTKAAEQTRIESANALRQLTGGPGGMFGAIKTAAKMLGGKGFNMPMPNDDGSQDGDTRRDN